MNTLETLAEETIRLASNDNRQLIVLKGSAHRNIDLVINALRKEIEKKGKSLIIVQKDPIQEHNPKLNGTFNILVDDNYRPTNHSYSLDINWIFNEYLTRN